MEKASKSFRDKIKDIPEWIATLCKVGGLVFMAGVMWNDVQTIKGRVAKYEGSQVQQIRMEGEITNLQDQIQQSRETSKQTTEAVTKLADAVNNLSISVATLQTRLEDNRKRR